ncbi:MAG: cellulase family glycosylhydrolase [Oscillospiraceae bacterium]|nr:cellulase family glycosylhydrolase [Oscillospiraceae bacterium]
MNFKKIICAFTAAAVMLGAVPVFNEAALSADIAITAEAAKLSSPTGIKASVSGDKTTISWKKVSGADGYRVYKYDSAKKAFVRLKTVAGTKTTVSGLSKGKHYFKIAAVDKVNGKYQAGTASSKITVTVKSSAAKTTEKNTAAATSSAPSEKANGSSVSIAKAMGNGWNLGNTMESVASWLGASALPEDYEKAWGQPITTEEIIRAVKNSGFDSVRIPVAWSNMMSSDGKYTISEKYFERVDEIVGYVLENDMYCIINIHWDGGWWKDFGSSDEKVQAEAMKKYKAMWTQIANHYADYSDKLIFESANEELGSGTKGNSSMAESYERVNMINQTFVDLVRSTGGKNKNRPLLIAGYDTDIAKTADSRFKMPTDSAKGKLLVSVHYYSPSTFCIADNESNSWGYKDSWGTQSDIDAMKKDLEKLKRFTDAGYGVVIGEYGVAHKKSGSSYTAKKGTDLFFKNVVELSEKYGFCPMLWDCSDWLSRKTCRFTEDYLDDIF